MKKLFEIIFFLAMSLVALHYVYSFSIPLGVTLTIVMGIYMYLDVNQ